MARALEAKSAVLASRDAPPLERFTRIITIYVVTGLPRSGTSLVMQMLQAGGVSVLYDEKREALLRQRYPGANPGGFFEFHAREQLSRGLPDRVAVKLFPRVLSNLRLPDYQYKVIVMQRDRAEREASYARMIGCVPPPESYQRMTEDFHGILEKWKLNPERFSVYICAYERLRAEPVVIAEELGVFLGSADWRAADAAAVVSKSESIKAEQPTKPCESVKMPTTGPGALLHKLIEACGFRRPHCGACAAFASQMNVWGYAGCLEHRMEIVGWLVIQAKISGVMLTSETVSGLVLSAFRGFWRAHAD